MVPRYELETPLSSGATIQTAIQSGYRAGYQGVVTRNSCALPLRTDKWQAWNLAYSLGEMDRLSPLKAKLIVPRKLTAGIVPKGTLVDIVMWEFGIPSKFEYNSVVFTLGEWEYELVRDDIES